ncbi:MAG: hypothetical protein A4E48_01632 [Methanosaeta sp. PtaU1.Bin060]|nr:MAG: hypothetical protein A4E48_01632 [Methanosaeta sp. PtaU1.Bin060]
MAYKSKTSYSTFRGEDHISRLTYLITDPIKVFFRETICVPELEAFIYVPRTSKWKSYFVKLFIFCSIAIPNKEYAL